MGEPPEQETASAWAEDIEREREPVSLTIDRTLPEAVRDAVRTTILGTVAETGNPEDPIEIERADLRRIIPAVTKAHTTLQVLVKRTEVFVCKVEPLGRLVRKVLREEPESDEDGTHPDYVTTGPEWQKYGMIVKTFRAMAKKINKPAKGGNPRTYQLTVDKWGFGYRGQRLSFLDPSTRKLHTRKAVEEWMREVNRQIRGATPMIDLRHSYASSLH